MYAAIARRSDAAIISIDYYPLRKGIVVEKWPQLPPEQIWVLTTQAIYEQVSSTLQDDSGHYNWKVQEHNGVWEFLANTIEEPMPPPVAWFAYVMPDGSVPLVWESHKGRLPEIPSGATQVPITKEQFQVLDSASEEQRHV